MGVFNGDNNGLLVGDSSDQRLGWSQMGATRKRLSRHRIASRSSDQSGPLIHLIANQCPAVPVVGRAHPRLSAFFQRPIRDQRLFPSIPQIPGRTQQQKRRRLLSAFTPLVALSLQ